LPDIRDEVKGLILALDALQKSVHQVEQFTGWPVSTSEHVRHAASIVHRPVKVKPSVGSADVKMSDLNISFAVIHYGVTDWAVCCTVENVGNLLKIFDCDSHGFVVCAFRQVSKG
jgi:hypothetical protein